MTIPRCISLLTVAKKLDVPLKRLRKHCATVGVTIYSLDGLDRIAEGDVERMLTPRRELPDLVASRSILDSACEAVGIQQRREGSSN